MSELAPQISPDNDDINRQDSNPTPEIAPTPEVIEIELDTPIIVESSDEAIKYRPMTPIEAFAKFPESFKIGMPYPRITTIFKIDGRGIKRTFNDTIRVELTDYGDGILRSWAQNLSNMSNRRFSSEDFIKNFRKNSENPREIEIPFWEFLQIFGNKLKETDLMDEESAKKYRVIDGPIQIITDILHTK